ncbi:E3 ubiquitin-protein ligase tom1 [Yamadazyma tenuis]|nr:E3 ubiquitin-protein ligase tom1 [Yamadazyma tenuis]
MEMTKPFEQFVEHLSKCPEPKLIDALKQNIDWNRPQGDLYHWIPLLNRFDEIFERMISKYGLEEEFVKLTVMDSDDEHLTVWCLKFTFMLLEHCDNRTLYNSSERIFSLINTPTLSIKLGALEVAISLGSRYIISSSKYPAPKEVKKKVLQIFHTYPPLVPASFTHEYHKKRTSDDQPIVLGDHFCFTESLKQNSLYPKEWKTVNFPYYKLQGSSKMQPGTTSSPSKLKSPKKESSSPKTSETLCTFSISADNTRKLSLEQILDKASEVIPEDLWFDFGLHAYVVKAFNSTSYDAMKLRHQLLQCKLYALCFIICSSGEEYISSKVFEPEPYIFTFLADMIHPAHMDEIPPEVYFSVVKTLSCTSLKKAWGNDLVRCLGGNVNHGVLYQSLRHIHKKLVNHDSDCNPRAYNYFFNMIGNLITLNTKLSGGLLKELMKFLEEPQQYWWQATGAVHLLSSFLYNSPDSLDDFVNNKGFDLMIKIVGDEVDQALVDPGFDGGAPKDVVVHYKINLRKANFMRELVKLVKHLIRWDSGDRLRNLFDSPILQSFNKILLNPDIFGPNILCLTLDSIFYIIDNDPTAFSVLNEANVIDTILDNFESLFIPSGDLLITLPEVLGAIALNKEGLKKIENGRFFEIYFKVFRDTRYCKILSQNYRASSVGDSLDELGRHFNSFKPLIIEEVGKLVLEIPSLVSQHIVGVRYFPASNSGAEIEKFETSEYGHVYNATASFLRTLVAEGNWSNEITSAVKFEDWLNLLEIPGAPCDFVSECVSAIELFSYFLDDEQDKSNMPIFYERMMGKFSTPLLEAFYAHPNTSSFFDLLSEDQEKCSAFLRDLNAMNIYMSVNSFRWDVIIPHERYRMLTEVFGSEVGLQFFRYMSALLEKVTVEEAFIRENIDKEILIETNPQPDEDSENPKIRVFWEDPSAERKPNHDIKTSSIYKNVSQMRSLCFHLMHHVADTFHYFGKIAMHRRQEYSQVNARRNAVKITIEIGQIFNRLIVQRPESLAICQHYTFTIVTILWYVIHHRDRGKDLVQTPLIVSCVQAGVFDSLLDVCRHIFGSIDFKQLTSEFQKVALIDSNLQSVAVHTIHCILTIFATTTDDNYYPNFQNPGYFYHTSDNNFDITSTTAEFILRIAVGVVQLIVYDVFKSDKEVLGRFPKPFVEKLVPLTTPMFSLGGKDRVFIPLDWKNVSPPYDQVEYLKEIGLSEENAIHYFKHANTLEALAKGNWPCPSSSIDKNELDRLSLRIRNDGRDFSSSFTETETHFSLGNRYPEESIYAWLQMTTYFPEFSEPISDFLYNDDSTQQYLHQKLIEITTTGSPFEEINEFMEISMPFIHGYLLHNIKEESRINSDKRQLYGYIFELTVMCLNNFRDVIEKDYWAYALETVAIALSIEDIQEPEESAHSSLADLVDDKIVENLSIEGREDELFKLLLSINEIKNKKSLRAIIATLLMLVKEDSRREMLSKSSLIKLLIGSGSLLTAENTPENHKAQLMLGTLVTRCFETPDVIRANMAVELNGILSHGRTKRELPSLLQQGSVLAVRDQSIFTDIISSKVRLHNYDGTRLSTSQMSIAIVEEETSEDVEMAESERTKPSDPIQPGQIIHAIVTQLVDVCKKDILTTPKEYVKPKNDKKKDQKILEIFQNTNFAYACYLLQVLTELLGSYMSCKLEFITYSKKSSKDKVKPRSTALNVLIHQLIPTQSLSSSSGIEYERRASISSLAKLAILALISTPIIDEKNQPVLKKENPDMAFVRKFCADLITKAMKETSNSNHFLHNRYSKLIDIFDLISALLSNRFRQVAGPLLNPAATKFDTFYISKAFLDNQVASHITSLVAKFDLNFPQVDKLIKSAIHPLSLLGKLKADFQESFEDERQEDDDLPELEDDDREDTPDLFRNSTLGMYDIEYDSEDEEMDYYGDEAELDVLSGDDVTDESEDDSQDIDDDDSDAMDDYDDMDEDDGDEEAEIMDDASMMESFHFTGHGDQEEDEDNSSEFDSNDSDVEIIDTTAVGMGSDASEYYFEEYDDDELEDRSSSEYDEAELDGWIEDLDDTEPSDNEDNQEEPGFNGAPGRRVPGSEREREQTNDNIMEEENMDSEVESNADEEFEGIGINTNRRRAGEFASSFFDALRPAMTRSLADVFGGIFTNTVEDHGALTGVIHIGRSGNSTSARFDRAAIETLFDIDSKQDHSSGDPLQNLYIRSTTERWSDSLPELHKKKKNSIALNMIPAIVNRIAQPSIELDKKRQEKLMLTLKEREEARKKREQEEATKREEEAKQREAELANNPRPQLEPVMVQIGDREVDISGTNIDPAFLEALPEDMREEVFTHHVRESRANARRGSSADATREIDPDFLDALPDQIREEILQQESISYPYSHQDEEDEDVDDFESDNEAVNISERPPPQEVQPEKKSKKKILFKPLVDKAGVASIVRLLYVPQSMTKRDNIHQTLKYLCYNKQTRVEVVNLLVFILFESLVNYKSNDKIFHHLTIKSQKDSTGKVKTILPLNASPFVVADQVLDLLLFLLENNNQLRYFFLTEHENPYLTKNKKHGKEVISKTNRYQINYLLRLLENNTLREDQPFMDILSRILQLTSRPLKLLKRSDESNKPIPFSPPYIPDYLFNKMVNILTSNECPNTTFTRAISAMQNFTNLEDAQRIFSAELSDQATNLGKSIIKDLNMLTQELGSGKYDGESKTFSKFNASSSDQAKLLRVLTALDYMFETNDKKNKQVVDDVEELAELYNKLALGSLWDALSDCLDVLEENSHLSNIATILLPLIEALMVVCKHSKVKEIPVKDAIKYKAKKVDFTKEPIESLFFSFTDEHKKILNQMVRTNPNLMSGPFSMLVSNPKVLEFDNKKNYFDRKLHEKKNEDKALAINVRRDQVFLDSYRALFFKSNDEFKNSRLDVNFKGESGIDAGGVTREWYQVLSRQMFNPDYALFTPVSSDSNTYHPNRTSYINPEHLSFFKFIGKIIGKAIFDGCFLDCHFSRAVYKQILGRSVSFKDMEASDLEYFKSLIWILENDITDVITEDFSVETDDYGEKKIIDLIPNGRNIPVTEDNKQEYVKFVVEYRLQRSVSEQMDNFLIGFHEMIPKDLVSIFDEQELELLISGLPDIDVQDWQNNTIYNNYSPSSLQIQWFWRAVKSFDNEERAKLLQFATGTSRVPLNGFKELKGANDGSKFSIHRDYGSIERLPSSHTCFNQIDLPAYESYETLRGSLLLAITEGHEGFGLA